MKTSSFVLAASLAAIVVTSGRASADDDASSIAAARSVGLEGLKLAEGGKCNEAVEKLDRAERLHHAPTTLAKLGECHTQLGHLVAGLEMLRRVTREVLPPDAPPAFVAAKARAQKVIDETQGRVAQLRITVAAPGGKPFQVTIDAEPVPPAMLDIDRPTDPGPHTIELTGAAYKRTSQAVTLKEGERHALQLTAEADPNVVVPSPAEAAPVAPASAPAPPPGEAPSPEGDRTSTTRILGWTLLGVGTAGVAVGTVAGILGLSTKSALDEACPQRSCPAGEQDQIDRLKTESLIGTIGLTVGAVGVLGGAAILLFGPPGKGKARASTARAPDVSVGPGGVSIRGVF